MNASPPSKDFIVAQLSLLAIRASELADRVRAGQVEFLDAVDLAQSAAEWSGLTEVVGVDWVQLVLAAAFDGCGESDRD